MKALQIIFPIKNKSEEEKNKILLNLEEFLLDKKIKFEINDSDIGIELFIIKEKAETMKDFIEEGSFTKKFGIDNKLFNVNNYKDYFKLVSQEIKQDENITNPAELDKLLVKVDKNDPKLKAVLNNLNKIKQKKS